MTDEAVTVARREQPHAPRVVLSALQATGLEASFVDEHSPRLGDTPSPVKAQVRAGDAERARAVLAASA